MERSEADTDLQLVRDLELRLLDPAVRGERAAVERLLDPDFTELGASGRSWDKQAVIELLAEEPGERAEVQDLAAERLALDVVLVTYRARTPARSSYRASVWVRHGDSWRVRFHQGTPIPE
jgi:ribonuclease HI